MLVFDMCGEAVHPAIPDDFVPVTVSIEITGHEMSSGLTYDFDDVLMLFVTWVRGGRDDVELKAQLSTMPLSRGSWAKDAGAPADIRLQM
eukprot:3847144-Pyramimonas_sp.AAC.1